MTSGKKRRKAVVDGSDCVACGCCVKVCPLQAIEIVRGMMGIEDISPGVGTVQSGVDHGDARPADRETHGQIGQPGPVLPAELGLGPEHGSTGVRIEPFHGLIVVGDVFVMIALDSRNHIQRTGQIQAFLGVGIVSDNIPEGDVFVHSDFPATGQDCGKRFQIGMDITENRIFHFNQIPVLADSRSQSMSLPGADTAAGMTGSGKDTVIPPAPPSRILQRGRLSSINSAI